MRVILTEKQMKLVNLINENDDFYERAKMGINKVKDGANKLYNIITFTTIAEFRDGDTDVGKISDKVDELQYKISNINSKVSDYYNRFIGDEETYDEKHQEKHYDLENRITVVDNKVWALSDIVRQLKPFSKVDEYGDGRENDWDSPFDDIKPIEL